MAVPYVCTTCRFRITQSWSRLAGQHGLRKISNNANTNQYAQSRAAIGDLLDQPTNGNSSASHAQGDGSTRGRYSGREMKPQQFLSELDKAARSVTAGGNSWRGPTSGDAPSSHAHLRQRQPLHPPRPPRAELPPELYNVVRIFMERFQAQDLPGAWSACRQIGHLCAQLPVDIVLALYAIGGVKPSFSQLLTAATKRWLESLRTGTFDPELPTPYSVLLLYHSLNNTSAEIYRPTLWHITETISDLRFARAGNNNTQAVQSGVQELMNIWRLCIGGWLTRKALGGITDANRTQFVSIADNEADWSFLPSATISSFMSTERRSPQMFQNVLRTLVPVPQPATSNTRQTEAARRDYASSALLTWDLLQTTQCHSSNGTAQTFADVTLYTPFVSLLDLMFKHSPSPRVPFLLQRKFKYIQDDPALLEHYKKMLARLNCEALPASVFHTSEASNNDVGVVLPDTDDVQNGGQNASAPDHSSGSSSERITFVKMPSNPRTERFALTQISRLGKALEREDMYAVENIRREIRAFADSHKADGDALPIEVYEHLMLVSLSLRNPKVAIETWNFMVQAGYKPSLKTYTVMLRGAQKSRDVLGMEAFWQKLRQAGFQPDPHAWSIRIFGLMKLRSASSGLKALYEMGQEWLTAARAQVHLEQSTGRTKQQAQEPSVSPSELLARYPGPVNGVPRPDLALMNAAISGLSTARPEEIPNAFSWGRSFGIEPDLTTYNALLSLAMRNSQAAEALTILRRMQERGVHADSTTWTVLLNSLFESGFLNNLDHAQQEDKILRFIDSLNDAENGLPGIDEKSYALVIDRLIKRYENTTAAAAVFAHMLSSGRQPTPHIYTILLTSYFNKTPQPDFAALDALWNQISNQASGYTALVDTTFYDRMIEGYARHHHIVGTKPMEDFLQFAKKSGKQPGWRALHSLARVYAEREQWNKLRNLIDEVRIAQREYSGRMARQGEDDFWRFVTSTGILRGEGGVRRRERGSPLVRAEQAAMTRD